VRILADLHHSSLYTSLIGLFEDRLGHTLFRPIGMEWFAEGFWAVNGLVDTARQYLSLDQGYTPSDGTPALNKMWISGLPGETDQGVWFVRNPEDVHRPHKACTLEWFKNTRFDVLIASIPAHIAPFQELIRRYQPHAKLIVQVGNAWDLDLSAESNLLCSSDSRTVRNFDRCHSIEYHQEFDRELFAPVPVPTGPPSVSSFTNVIHEYPRAWHDFRVLEEAVSDARWRSYGGQCRDGCLSLQGVAQAMAECTAVFHVKPGGDGYGHIVHNAYARGRVIITRRRDYAGSMAERLMVDPTVVDLDVFRDHAQAANYLTGLLNDHDAMAERGAVAARRFDQVVDFAYEAEQISEWMEHLR